MFSVVLNMSQVITSPRKSSFYYMCSGLDPTANSKLSNGFNEHLEVASIVIHIVIWFRIWKERKKINPEMQVGGLRTLTSDRLKDIDRKSLTSFVTNVSGLIVLCMFLAVASKYQRLTLDEMNAYPNFIYAHIIFVLGPPTIGMMWNGVIFIKHEDFRQKFFRIIMAKLQKRGTIQCKC